MLKWTTKPLRRRVLVEEGQAESSKMQHSENTDKWYLCKAGSFSYGESPRTPPLEGTSLHRWNNSVERPTKTTLRRTESHKILKRTTKPLRRRILIEEGLAKSSKKQHSENTDKWHLCKACSWNANQNKARRRAGYKKMYEPPPSPPHPKEAFRTKGALWNAEQSKTLTTIAIDRRSTRKKP